MYWLWEPGFRLAPPPKSFLTCLKIVILVRYDISFAIFMHSMIICIQKRYWIFDKLETSLP